MPDSYSERRRFDPFRSNAVIPMAGVLFRNEVRVSSILTDGSTGPFV